MRVLVVENDPEIVAMLVKLLKKNDYIVDHQDNISDAFAAMRGCDYDAVLIDRMLNDGDGLDLIKRVRRESRDSETPPFIVLSALSETSDKVEGLDVGAVDYLTKPFEPDELLARLRVCIKYKVGGMVEAVEYGNLVYNMVTRQISVDGQRVIIRRRELAIFDTLIRKFGNFVTYEDLENKVYSYDEIIDSNSLTSQVSRLRKVLSDSHSGLKLRMMRNVGYMLDVDV